MEIIEAESIALNAVSHIFADDTASARYLALTGLSFSDVKDSIEDRGFLLSVLDYLMQNEPDLLAYAEESRHAPETIVKAWQCLGGQPSW